MKFSHQIFEIACSLPVHIAESHFSLAFSGYLFIFIFISARFAHVASPGCQVLGRGFPYPCGFASFS